MYLCWIGLDSLYCYCAEYNEIRFCDQPEVQRSSKVQFVHELSENYQSSIELQ
jgi:hypothetical protein